jgi:hypothetical protein
MSLRRAARRLLALQRQQANPLCSIGAQAGFVLERGGQAYSTFQDDQKKLLNQNLLVDTLELVSTDAVIAPRGSHWICPGMEFPAYVSLHLRELVCNLHAQTRNFEKAGLPRHSAEQLAEQIAALIVSNKLKMDEAFVNRKEVDKVRGAFSC